MIDSNGNDLQIGYGTAGSYPQYVSFKLNNSYLRLNPNGGCDWGTSAIIFPSFFSGGTLYQGTTVSATWGADGSDYVVQFSGTLAGVSANGTIRLSPPVNDSISAAVSMNASGSVPIDNRATCEGFQLVKFATMNDSALIGVDVFDASQAQIDGVNYPLTNPGALLVSGTCPQSDNFGMLGGTNTYLGRTVPTVMIQFISSTWNMNGWMAGFTSGVATPCATETPNASVSCLCTNAAGCDNIGVWAASKNNVVESSWSYTITASKP